MALEAQVRLVEEGHAGERSDVGVMAHQACIDRNGAMEITGLTGRIRMARLTKPFFRGPKERSGLPIMAASASALGISGVGIVLLRGRRGLSTCPRTPGLCLALRQWLSPLCGFAGRGHSVQEERENTVLGVRRTA